MKYPQNPNINKTLMKQILINFSMKQVKITTGNV